MSGFPTDWQFANQGLPASVTIPAAGQSVRHVLTFIDAQIQVRTAMAANDANLQVIDSIAGTLFLWRLAVPTTVAGDFVKDEFSADLVLLGSPGASLTINFNAAVGTLQQLLVKGYDL